MLDDVSSTTKSVYISRTTLDSERQWTPLHLERKPEALLCLQGTMFRILSGHRALESIGKVLFPLPEPATEQDRSVLTSFNPVG